MTLKQQSDIINENFEYLDENKQDKLIDGVSIKTINNQSILGSGNIHIEGGGSGTDDYQALDNLPQVNSVTLIGNKTLDDLGIQGTISDLGNIRSGAELGSTALQSIPSEYVTETELSNYHDSTKQNTISDLDNIRSGASKGATALQSITSSNVTTALGYTPYNSTNPNGYITSNYHDSTKQDVIGDLDTIRSNAQTGANLAPQVEVNTQRIEDLTTSRIPDVIYRGTPKITGGQVTNFSTVNYLLFPFEDISRGLPFDIYFSFTTDADVTTQQNIIDSRFGIALAIQNGKGVMALSSNGTNWDIGSITGTNTILPNSTYYVKYSWTGSQYNASLSTNDQSYVPDMIINSNKSPFKTTIYIGGSEGLFGTGTAHPFKGIINFTKSKVVVNGTTVWEGMADVGVASRANVSLSNLDEAGEARFNTKQDVITDLATIRSGASKGSTALQSITSSNVTTALGYTPYNATNPNGYITSSALSGYATENFVTSQGYITSSYHDSTKQNITDNTLTTTDKTIVGAINELNAKSSGGTKVTFRKWGV